MEPITTLRRAVHQTGAIVAGVKPDDHGRPTPCQAWDVAALLNHTIGGIRMFGKAARGEKLDVSLLQADPVGPDAAAAYNEAAASLQEALHLSGVLDQTWDLPFGLLPGTVAIGLATIETLQHGWDLAKATDRRDELDPELGEAGLEIARRLPTEQARQQGVFGPEVPCPDDAAPHDRLAALLGRQL
ncbi:MAG: hypothetical protein QOG64_694 [Acidimicrobiaceae bacterium]|jgi:uncharacterized protein (TIGR03086 family)|nr:hypothetical protein [Acidimicrobiaceae bacterium]